MKVPENTYEQIYVAWRDCNVASFGTHCFFGGFSVDNVAEIEAKCAEIAQERGEMHLRERAVNEFRERVRKFNVEL